MESQAELRSIFRRYAAAPTGSDGDGTDTGAPGLRPADWLALCGDTGLVDAAVLEQAFAAAEPEEGDGALLDETGFLASLVHLANLTGGDAGDEPRADLSVRLARLLSDYVLRFAARDTSTTFNRALGVRPAAKRFLDETRAAFSGGGVSWEQWLSLWHALDFSSLPAFHLWERDVFRALSKTFGVLLRVYSCYAKRALLRALCAASSSCATCRAPRDI